MKISFDLDDTLIPGNRFVFSSENRNLIHKLLDIERLRKGTKKIIMDLKNDGCEVGIYTTSYRSKFKILIQFLTYGIRPDFIINEKENRITLDRLNISSSKYPPAFGIDIHIDDLKGVGIEGQKYNFRTLIIEKSDTSWVEKVREACANSRRITNNQNN